MEGGKFFSVPYGNRNEMKMLMLRQIGGYAMYGRWVALLGMLYERKGLIDMNDALMRKIVCMELDLEDADEFFTELANIGLIDAELYHSMSHVVNKGVCKELEYYKAKAEAGKKSGEVRRGKSKRTETRTGK